MLTKCTNSETYWYNFIYTVYNISSKYCLTVCSNIVCYSFCDIFITKEVLVTVRCPEIIGQNMLCFQLEN